MYLCAGEEEGRGNHIEDGRGMSKMSVRIRPELVGRKGTTTDQTFRAAHQ